ncbi:MFS transporter [Salinisphaera sp. Q1T1-3]|uniref:MFS transporter n=1 Tax=Salinisphaera sp. Q1T1-3 TaxID=2321229 RepID=UPI000E7660A5|nr:MFS transporter [Salinisphaera sp. Q1T1-3]RJS94884.1 MFS transporter [Salinisphaera sp. Q1T1-3]
MTVLSGWRIFRSLHGFNYRVWVAGAFFSNVGTWVQRTAQTWLVLTILTRHSASAVGLVMALQFGPQFLLLPWTGLAADRLNQRKLLLVTQGAMGVLALGLGLLTVAGAVRLWHVYVFALLFGSVAAFDAPVRQTFVAQLVGDEDLSNAVALNSTSFNAARMIGPAVSGVVIAGVGTGWAFLINGVSFLTVLIALALLRVADLHAIPRAARTRGGFVEGFRYVRSRPDLRVILVMLFLMGTFGLNFPIFVSTMAVGVFHAGAAEYGLLSSIMAIGTIAGALFNASLDRPAFRSLLVGAALFGIGCTLAAIAPSYGLFALVLVPIGGAALIFTNTTNSLIQLSTEPTMRGRVMALRVSVAMGGTPIGAPIVGWVADHCGPRWALGIGAAAGLGAALVALRYQCRDATAT